MAPYGTAADRVNESALVDSATAIRYIGSTAGTAGGVLVAHGQGPRGLSTPRFLLFGGAISAGGRALVHVVLQRLHELAERLHLVFVQ